MQTYSEVEKDKLKFSVLNLGRAERRDCSVIALAIAYNRPYSTVFQVLEAIGRTTGEGVSFDLLDDACTFFGPKLKWEKAINKEAYHYMQNNIGQDYSEGTYLCVQRNHVFALVNGEVQDSKEDRELPVLLIAEVKGGRNARAS